jgi:hypothetical protein
VRSTTQPGRTRRRLTVLTVVLILVLAVLPGIADHLSRVLPEEDGGGPRGATTAA